MWKKIASFFLVIVFVLGFSINAFGKPGGAGPAPTSLPIPTPPIVIEYQE